MIAGAIAVMVMIALYVLADKYLWARYTFGAIVFIAFVLVLLRMH